MHSPSFRHFSPAENIMNSILSAQGVIKIKPCGVAYWLITLFQLPAAVAFTVYIMYDKRKKRDVHSQEDGKVGRPANFILSDYYCCGLVAKLKATWTEHDMAKAGRSRWSYNGVDPAVTHIPAGGFRHRGSGWPLRHWRGTASQPCSSPDRNRSAGIHDTGIYSQLYCSPFLPMHQ